MKSLFILTGYLLTGYLFTSAMTDPVPVQEECDNLFSSVIGNLKHDFSEMAQKGSPLIDWIKEDFVPGTVKIWEDGRQMSESWVESMEEKYGPIAAEAVEHVKKT